MLDTNQEFYTAELIVKSVHGTLSDQEKVDFEKWLKISKNKEFYNRILKVEDFEYKIRLLKNVNKDAAYLKLLERIEKKQQKVEPKATFIFRNILKYAAVAVLLITVGYGFFYFLSRPASEIDTLKVSDLKPGHNKATLVLEDGTEVNLEKNDFVKKQSRAEINNKNNSITYKSNGKNRTINPLGNIGTNTLHIPVGGIYKLVLADGSTVWLNSSSSLKYPISFEGDQRIVELTGEAYFEIMKDDKKDFIVKTKMRNISVLGTSFNVSAYNDDNFFATTLAEGKIKLIKDGKDEVFLNPGEQAWVNKKSLKTVQVKAVDPKVYTAWKNGTFYFENESLENILRKVGRWYNFKTDFSNPQLREIAFTGLASKDFSAKRILDRISKSANINYEIIQNAVNDENLIIIRDME